MSDKGWFGATKSEVNRMKNEVKKDIFGDGGTKKSSKRKSRRRKKR